MAHRDDVYGLKQFFVKKEIEKYPLVLYETTQWAKYIINTNMAANPASTNFNKGENICRSSVQQASRLLEQLYNV